MAENERSSYQQYLAGIANLLLGMTMYYHANHQFVSLDVVRQIDRARRIMREELYANISPDEVARRVNMSYSWFRKMFRDYTNISPARYMQELRLQEAWPPVVGNGHEHQGDRLPAQLRRRFLFFQHGSAAICG